SAMNLDRLRDAIQHDPNNRGLARDPGRNLINACPDDFRRACESLAKAAHPGLAVVTGFFIPTANPPAAETDGPLGALFLARALHCLGIRLAIITDSHCEAALKAGLAAWNLEEDVGLLILPSSATDWQRFVDSSW